MCAECYDEVVVPELVAGKAIPAMFNKDTKRIPKASCQLYSPRMRGIFRTAVDAGDYKLLAGKARERRTVEGAWRVNVGELRHREKAGGEVGREIRRCEEEWRRWE